MPLFEREPDGSSRGQRYIMGRRNYCEIDWDRSSGDVIFDVRIEKEKGVGQTVGCVSFPSITLSPAFLVVFSPADACYLLFTSYTVRAPPPRW